MPEAILRGPPDRHASRTASPTSDRDGCCDARQRHSGDDLNVTGVHRYIECNQQVQITGRARGARPDRSAAAARAGARRRAEHQPAPVDAQGLEPARLHPVVRRQELLRPRRPGLGSRAVEAVRGRPDRDVAEPADRGQPAVVSPRDRDELRHGRPLGLVGQPLDRRGEPARHRPARLPASSPAPSIPSSWSSCASSRSPAASPPARTSRATCSPRACSTRSST